MIDIDSLISEEIMYTSASALEGWPMAESDMPDVAGSVLSAGGPPLVTAALRKAIREAVTRRAAQPSDSPSYDDGYADGVDMVLAVLREFGGIQDEPKNWWVSWYAPPAEAKIGFEYHGPWWVTGSRDTQDTIVAAVQAPTEEAARQVIIDTHDAGLERLEWRFVEEHPEDWNPFASDRFPRAEWMRWPYPAEA